MSDVVDFPEGSTFHGLISWVGLILAVGGSFLVVLQILVLLGIVLIPVGFVLFLNRKGVVIDLERKRVRPYQDLVVVKVGAWMPLERFDRVEFFRYTTAMFMWSRASSAWIRSFDTALVSRNGTIRLELGSFTDRNKAEAKARRIAQATGLRFVDKLPPRPDPATRRR